MLKLCLLDGSCWNCQHNINCEETAQHSRHIYLSLLNNEKSRNLSPIKSSKICNELIMRLKSSKSHDLVKITKYMTGLHSSSPYKILVLSHQPSSLRWRNIVEMRTEQTHTHHQNSALCTSQKIRRERDGLEPVMFRCHRAG